MAWIVLDRLRVAFAFLREPRRWSVAGLAVVLGTVGLILADGFIERIFRDFREEIVRSHFGHLQVLPADEHAQLAGKAAELSGLRATVEQALRPYPGALTAARLSFVGLASHGDRTVSFLGEGIEPDRERTLSSALVVKEGQGLSRDDALEVLVGEGLAQSLGVSPGDQLTLLANTAAGGVNAVEVAVTGIFYTATKAYDDRAVRLPLRTAQRLARTQALSRLIMVLPDTGDVPAAARRLRGVLGDGAVVVKEWHQLADFYNKTVDLFSAQLAVVRAVILAIVLLSVSNTLARGVMERTSEIGTMMALGHRRVAVARVFLLEGLAIGMTGGAIGVVAGWGLAFLVSSIGIPMPPPPGMARGFIGGIAFSGGIAASAFAFAVVTAVLASLMPALRASRLDVVDALRAGR